MSAETHIPAKRPRSLLFGVDHLLHIRTDQLSFYARLQKTYGDVVRLRLGPYRIWYLFHPDAIEPVLTRQAGEFIRFRRMMDVLRQWNGDSLLLAEGRHWRDRRRKVLPAFQSRRLPAYGEQVVSRTARFCDMTANRADSRGEIVFDADQAMAQLSLDIAIRTMFGTEHPTIVGGVEKSVQDLSDIAFAETTSLINIPRWLPLPIARRKYQAMKVMDEFVTGLVSRALAHPGSEKAHLIFSLIKHHEGRAQAIRDDAMGLLIAGHETSGALLSWAFAMLAAFPAWLERAIDEVDTVLGCKPAGTPDLARLPIITAILHETLRLYPPAYTLFLRQALRDVDIRGHRVRRGDLVQIIPYITQRDDRFFEEAKRFDPARFIREADWPTYAYLPFGAGPRVCIGQNFGLMETGLVLATVLQRMVPEHGGPIPKPMARFSLRPTGGLPMTWRARR